MIITSNFKAVTPSGGDLCSQGESALSLTNLAVTLRLDGVQFFTTNNLASASPFTGAIGSTGISVASMTINTGSSYLQFQLDGITMWDKHNLSVEVSKSGHIAFQNVFEIYGYDLGNVSGSNNPLFDITLISNSALDSFGYQEYSFSKLTAYRRPFTDEVHVYNLVGTLGTKTYENGDGDEIGSGNSFVVCSNEAIDITQIIKTYDRNCTETDSCSKEFTVDKFVWFPTLTKSHSYSPNCNDDCISIVAENIVESLVEYENITTVYVNGTESFPFATIEASAQVNVVYELYDYLGALVDDQTTEFPITLGSYNSDPSSFTAPIQFIFETPSLGEVICKIRLEIEVDTDADDVEDTVLYECEQYVKFKACNWWKIEKSETCGQYTITNCSFENATITIQQLNDDKVFETIDTVDIDSLDTETITLEEDGVYQFSTPIQGNDGYERVIIANYCGLETCFKKYLDKVICVEECDCDECNKADHYNFNALLINFHTYLMMLNDEFTFNYVYTSISTTKIADLYTLKSFIERFTEYCTDCVDCCKGCNE